MNFEYGSISHKFLCRLLEIENKKLSAGFLISNHEIFFSSFFGKFYYNFYKENDLGGKMKLTTLIHAMTRRLRLCIWGKRQQIYIGIGVLLGVSLLISYILYNLALNKVILEVDGESFIWKTLNSSVKGVLHEKGITLNDGDVVKPALQTAVTDNLNIEVIRAFPVIIKIADDTINYNTITQTVRDLLAQAGLKYSPDDKISPGLDTIVKPYQQIRIIRVTSTIITRHETIKPAVEYRKDPDLERGKQKKMRTGKPGLAERQIKVIYEDGREIRHYKIGEKIVKYPVSSIILAGTKPVIRTLLTSRGSYRYVEMKIMKATAYYPGPESCGKYAAYGETYTGKKAGFGVVAVDPKVIPLGTKLYIAGYGKAEAADIGSAIKGNRIDLCYETFREAAMFGVKKIRVYLLFE